MEERKVTVTLSKAREWFNSRNAALREVALQAFDKDEFTYNFKNITTSKEACEVLGFHHGAIVSDVTTMSVSVAAMLKLNIIRRALNLGFNMYFAKNRRNSFLYYPYNPLVTIPKGYNYYKEQINSGILQIIGKVKIEGVEYNVLYGGITYNVNSGLGGFNYQTGICRCSSEVSLFGCATKEIAKHFGKYFGMLITEAKYADITDFEIIESKYAI